MTSLAVLLAVQTGQAVELAFGGFDVRLDTTVRLSLGLRTEDQNPALLQDANSDDGDRAFRPGAISERVDFISVLDMTRGDFGAEVSIDGWYDAAYHQADANTSAATFNPLTAFDKFPADTRRLLGETVELGTAFVRDRFQIGGVPVTLRLGRQSLLWGESLFFPEDGLSAGQAPVDGIKALSQPLVQNQEVFLPVTQAYLRADLGGGFSLQGYEQLEWRRDRTPGVASYFSSFDAADVGGQRAFLPGGVSVFRARDATPDGFDQFGVALRYASGKIDLGLYALRYDSKSGFLQTASGAYHLVFPRGIETVGMSVSTYAGDSTLSGEVSVRRHMPLVSQGFSGVSGSVEPPAFGQTLLALASYQHVLPTGRLWQGAALTAELSTTELLDLESGGAHRLPGTTRFSSAAQAVFAPQYFEVLPQLELTLPVGVRWGLSGRSSVDPAQVARVGNITVGITAAYRAVWLAGVSFTHFLGPVTQQRLADRDFLTVSISRTF